MKQRNEGVRVAMRERAAVYRFLSGLYLRECQDEYLRKLTSQGFPETGEGQFSCGCKSVNEYLSAGGDGMRQELACDYAKVFLGAGVYDGEAANPYESVYASEARLLMQEPRDEVLRLYRAESVAVRQEEGAFLPEDHLSFELAFMAHYAERTAEALEDGDPALAVEYLEKQASFLRNHLNNWVPLLCEDVRSLARTGFYRGLADVTQGFLSDDERCLEDLKGVLSAAA